jgi:hypothetical protein
VSESERERRKRERAVVAATEMKPEIMAACHMWGKFPAFARDRKMALRCYSAYSLLDIICR